MAKFSFMHDTFKGRLGPVVYSSWRGIDYAKEYTPPKDPHTPEQMNVRGNWAYIGHITKQIYIPLLKPYTFPVPQKMTAFNLIMKINREEIKRYPFRHEKMKIFEGLLDISPITTCSWDNTAKKITVQWDNSSLPGGTEALDNIFAIGIQEGEIVFIGSQLRSVAKIEATKVNNPRMHNGGIHVYLVFSRTPANDRENGTGFVSNTQYKAASIAELAEAPEAPSAPQQEPPAATPASHEGDTPS